MTLTMTNVPTAAEHGRGPDRDELDADLADVALDGARHAADGGHRQARPSPTAPNMPPTPWTAKTSSASSMRRRSRSSVAL